MKHYFLKVNEKPEFGVTRAEYLDAEVATNVRESAEGEPTPQFLADFTHPISGIDSKIAGRVVEVECDYKLPTVIPMSPLPAKANPFNYDSHHMGTDLVRGWIVMHPGYDHRDDPTPLEYMILVNQRTGQRFKLDLDTSYPEFTNKLDPVAEMESLAEQSKKARESRPSQDDVFVTKCRELCSTARLAYEEARQYAQGISDAKLRKTLLNEVEDLF